MVDANQIKQRLAIDKLSLDDEFVQQPQLFYSVSEAYVEAVALRDTLKEELSTVDAELDGLVREEFEKRELKATEAMVKGEIQIHPKHKKAFDKWIAAKTEADKLAALKEAFHQRSFMLRDLASLYVANYFDQSSVQGTSSQDKVTYDQRRRTMAEQRVGRNRIKEK